MYVPAKVRKTARVIETRVDAAISVLRGVIVALVALTVSVFVLAARAR